jgi:hypothetical protein
VFLIIIAAAILIAIAYNKNLFGLKEEIKECHHGPGYKLECEYK